MDALLKLLSFAVAILVKFFKVLQTKLGFLTLLSMVQELLSHDLDGGRRPVLNSWGPAVLYGVGPHLLSSQQDNSRVEPASLVRQTECLMPLHNSQQDNSRVKPESRVRQSECSESFEMSDSGRV